MSRFSEVPERRSGVRRVALLVAALLFASIGRASDAPKWLAEYAVANRAAPGGDPAARVLLDERVVAVDDTGATVTTRRFAIEILNKSGADHAAAVLGYLEKRDVVKRSEAWLVRGAKTIRHVPAREWLDARTISETELIGEARQKMASLANLAVPGDVFGFEARVDGALLFAGTAEEFGWTVPALMERFQLQVPPGFAVETLVDGTPAPTETVSADRRTWTWELKDRPQRRPESWSDPAGQDAPTLRLRLRPPETAKRFKPPVFLTWADATRWELQLDAGQCDTSVALHAKVEQLTAGRATTWERIRALAEFVQDVRYIQVNRELARGFGLRPRKATEVLSTGYGDCKDKANLLCAMLREAGVTAHRVGVLAGGDAVVNPAWPSLDQFDHAITAIEVSADVDAPTVVAGPDGRRLLIFDPTDDDTPIGGLPWNLQGSFGQLVREGTTELLRLPQLPTGTQFVVRHHATLALQGDGSVKGKAEIEQRGQSAAWMRARYHRLTEKELTETLLKRIGETLRGASLQRVNRHDDRPASRYAIELDLAAPGFAQPLRESLALVRLDVLSRDVVPQFSEKTRRTPVRVRPLEQSDAIELNLPEGVAVDELPPPAKLGGVYGSYERSFETRGTALVFNRRLVLHGGTVPVADYPALRQFLADVAKADRAAVVLKR